MAAHAFVPEPRASDETVSGRAVGAIALDVWVIWAPDAAGRKPDVT